MSKGFEGPRGYGGFIWECGKSRHLDASVEGRGRILCPVTPSGAPRLCSILSSWCPPTRRTKQNTIRELFSLFFSPSSPSPRCRNRNSSATRKCHAFLQGGKCSSSNFYSFLLLFISSRWWRARMTQECLSTCFGQSDLNCSYTILAQVAVDNSELVRHALIRRYNWWYCPHGRNDFAKR